MNDRCPSHQVTSQLFHNKFVVVLGDSIQRAVYKDLVLLLQKDEYLSPRQLKAKGEMSFEQDHLVDGGCLKQLHNGTEYEEVRQFQSDHHLVRFYFVTRIYSSYMKSILEDLRKGLKPDLLIVNSCVWDITRYRVSWVADYKQDLHTFFSKLKEILPEETLVIWNLAMPLGQRMRGGFLIPEVEHMAPHLRHDVIEANFYSGTLADLHGMDVLDLHFHFRFSLQHRVRDGVHWNAIAHRRITSLLLQHAAQAWGVALPCPLTTVEPTDITDQRPDSDSAREPTDSLPAGSYLDFKENNSRPQNYCREPARSYRPALPPVYRNDYDYGRVMNGFYHRPSHHFDPYQQNSHHVVMRNRQNRWNTHPRHPIHTRHHYAPYIYHRPSHSARRVHRY